MSERDGWMDGWRDPGGGSCREHGLSIQRTPITVSFANPRTLLKSHLMLQRDTLSSSKLRNPFVNIRALQAIFILCSGPSFGNIYDLIRNTNRPQVLLSTGHWGAPPNHSAI